MAEIEEFADDIRLLHRGDVTSKVIAGVGGYWDEQSKGSHLPPKSAIDPFALKPWLPYLSISEIHADPFRLRYRLVGTEIVRMVEFDFTGQWLDETGWPQDIIELNTALYRRVCETRRPLFGLSTVIWDGRVDFRLEWAVFPFSTDGAAVTHCLGVDDYSAVAKPQRNPLR